MSWNISIVQFKIARAMGVLWPLTQPYPTVQRRDLSVVFKCFSISVAGFNDTSRSKSSRQLRSHARQATASCWRGLRIRFFEIQCMHYPNFLVSQTLLSVTIRSWISTHMLSYRFIWLMKISDSNQFFVNKKRHVVTSCRHVVMAWSSRALCSELRDCDAMRCKLSRSSRRRGHAGEKMASMEKCASFGERPFLRMWTTA